MLLTRSLVKHAGILTRSLSHANKVASVETTKGGSVVSERSRQNFNELERVPANSDIEDILNKKHQISVNDTTTTGFFGLSLLDSENGFQLYLDSVIERCDGLLKEIESSSPQDSILLSDQIVENVGLLTDLAAFIAQSSSERKVEARKVYAQAEQYITTLNNNTVMFRALKRVAKDEDLWKKMDGESQRVVAMLLLDYKHSGIELSKQKREELQNINKEIALCGVEFVKKTVEPVKIPIDTCPEQLLGLPAKDDKIIVSNWCDDYTSDAVRESAWCAFYKHNPEQERALHYLLNKRHELAHATGYRNYAERVLQGSMAGSPETVSHFLSEVHEQVRPLGRWESYQLERAKFMDGKFWKNQGFFKINEVVIFPWDPKFQTDDMKKYYIKTETRNIYPNLPDFLSVGSVVEQIGVWLEDTFSVTLIPEIPQKGELWSPDVIKLAVEHDTQGLLGFLYLDLYPTGTRHSPPCHHIIRSGTNKSIPVSVIECNYHPSDGYKPPYLDMSTLEELFKELGSAVHSMLSRTNYYQSSASFLSPDIKRISSYILQNISRHPAFLYHVMKHHTRTRILPRIQPDKIVAMTNAMNIFSVHELEYQLLYSALDQTLHTQWPYTDGRTSTDVFARHTEEYTHLPYIEDTAPHLRFSGLYTQGGKYYSHLWCKAIANILYEELFSADPFSRHGGEYFREHFLNHGASRNPTEMVEYLIGTKLTPDRLASALVRPHELAQNYSAGYLPRHGKITWQRDVSAGSPLLSRLSKTHPHLVTEGGEMLEPPPFEKRKLVTSDKKNLTI